jgi:hypothetical protein
MLSLYLKYLNKIDYATLHNSFFNSSVDKTVIYFSYNKFVKYFFIYSNKHFSTEAININVYLFFFIIFNGIIRIKDKSIKQNQQKERDLNIFLEVLLIHKYKKNTINKFIFDFLFCFSFSKLIKKNKTLLLSKFPNIFNNTLKYLELKKNEKFNLKFVYTIKNI